jgi:type VII secretion integral membrane protein EccD
VSSTTGADLCRVTIVGPKRRVDISLPADVSFAQLFPAILHYSGDDLADAGLAHGGWVLQRLDEAPFGGDTTPGQANLRDGELLYLRPGMSQLPELAFDDVADVVATGINDLPDRWRPEWTRAFTLSTAAGASVVAAAILLLSGPSWILPAIVAGVISLILVLTGVGLSRAAGDSGAGAVFGFMALPHAFLAGLLAAGRSTPLFQFGAPHLLVGFAAVVLVGTIAAIAIADGLPIFLGAVLAAFMGVIGAGASVLDGVSAPAVSGIIVAVTLALTPLVPTISFRLARVTLPPVPTSAEDLRRDTLTVDGRQLLRRTARADRFVTGTALALGITGFAGQIPLAFAGGWAAPTTSAVIALALLLRSRLFRGRTQRLALMVPGMAGLAMLTLALSLGASQPAMVVGSLLPLMLGAGIAVSAGLWLPDHRPSPFWPRAADILDLLIVLSLIPLALGVAGLYAYIRGATG